MAFARVAAVIGVLVLICVPALTRAGQKLETSSRAPSFRNIDCPPKKLAMTVVQAVASTMPSEAVQVPPAADLAPVSDTTPQSSPYLATPGPLRAPPSAFLS
jgi:hypothetical protein